VLFFSSITKIRIALYTRIITHKKVSQKICILSRYSNILDISISCIFINLIIDLRFSMTSGHAILAVIVPKRSAIQLCEYRERRQFRREISRRSFGEGTSICDPDDYLFIHAHCAQIYTIVHPWTDSHAYAHIRLHEYIGRSYLVKLKIQPRRPADDSCASTDAIRDRI